MASGNITITAPKGPGGTVTSLLLSNARSIKFDMAHETFIVEDVDGKISHYDYETIATVTYTISAELATIAVST